MSLILSNTEIVSKMRYEFLKINRKGDPLDISQFKNKFVIYAIENLNNHKIYIGKTTHLLNRANNYIFNYRKFLSRDNVQIGRAIIDGIITDGIENFRMYPIAVATSREELAQLEREYIVQYNTLVPNGYNDMIPSSFDYKRKNYVGYPQPISAKIAKSKLVACINPTTKDFVVAIGMKTFGDFMSASKDLVKNCAKRGSKLYGYNIIYLNNYDRELIKSKMYNRCNHSKNLDDYLTALSYVELMLDEQSAQCLIDAGYTCRFLSYPSSEDSDSLFEFYDIDVLFQYLNK